jgi:hypothetical protein
MTKAKEVLIQATYPLSGTLTTPDLSDSRFPAILLIAGSGNGDRDGNQKKLEMNIYKDLADFFTAEGFVTLRYDKRGIGQSGGSFLETGVFDLIDDAVDCVRFLKSHPKVDPERILIVGHSEGAIIAPAVYKEIPVAGLVLLAGAADANRNISAMQTEQLYKELEQKRGIMGWFYRTFNLSKKVKKQNEKLISRIMESDKDVMRIKGMKQNAKWLREFMNFDISDYLAGVTCPVLAITGEKDIQVPPEDAKRIAEAVPGEAEWHIIPDMNHIFRKFEGEHTILGIMKEYKAKLKEPIDKDLLDTMSTWLEAYTK